MEDIKSLVFEKLKGSGAYEILRNKIKQKLIENPADPHAAEDENAMIESPQGKMCLEILMNFLDMMKMEYTMSVLIPECGIQDEETDFQVLEPLKLEKEEAIPFIFQVVKKYIENYAMLTITTDGRENTSSNVGDEENQMKFKELNQQISIESEAAEVPGDDPPIYHLQIDEFDYIENTINKPN